MGGGGGRQKGEEEGHRMMCWKQVHLHSVQTQHKPFLGVSILAAPAGRFTALFCVCICVCMCVRPCVCVCVCAEEQEGYIDSQKHNVQEQEHIWGEGQ